LKSNDTKNNRDKIEMQTEPSAKQQIVEKIKNSTNILVTVGNSPSVDALSAALSLTFMLNRLDKHATAVFSGQIPPAINFLEPGKTFESTVDSLRDFIIALDKEKADRLRYKVEDDVVRIFITPYKTILSQDDLKFSQGDFNVELIIALGVEKREDLDTAITAHGRILHDATVMTINAEQVTASLGSVDWSDTSASSLCEMLMSLSEALQSGLLDEQISTALLTGIVAATDRFRNDHTTPKVMTMAAQLMAAGANQQLIAAKLEEGHELPTSTSTIAVDGTTNLEEGKSQKLADVTEPVADTKADGALEITHTPVPDAQPLPDPSTEALKEAEQELAESLAKSAPAAPTLSVNDLQSDLAAAADEVELAATSDIGTNPPQIIKQERSWRTEPVDEPAFGGTLNATASEAEDAKREEEQDQTNRQILSHDSPSAAVAPAEPELEVPAFTPPVAVPPVPSFEETKPLESTSDDSLSFEPAPVPVEGPTLAELDTQTRGQAEEDARAAVDAALSAMPFNPAGKPLEAAGTSPALDVTHNPEPTLASEPPVVQPEPTSASLPPLPDFSTLPPLPGEVAAPAPTIEPTPFNPGQIPDSPVVDVQPLPTPPAPQDPGQFKIPGQP
jgi:hypothetical protein